MKIYNLFYVLNSLHPQQKEEILFDFNFSEGFDEILNELPEFEPSNEVLEKILKIT
jgi:hypothetical protein